MHEASLYESNCFVTLTYSAEHLPPYGSLRKSDFQGWMKRLRARYPSERIRFFHCGEYGSVTSRPHYHCLLFGFDFPDKVEWGSRRGHPVWRSPILEKLWPYGQSEIGSVTFESACYVARYIVDKVTGERADGYYSSVDAETGEVVRITPEYCTMSRRPGIGAEWFRRYGREVYIDDGVVVRGKLQKPPRFYDGMYELVDAAEMAAVRRRRVKLGKLDSSPERLAVREQVAVSKLTFHRSEDV